MFAYSETVTLHRYSDGEENELGYAEPGFTDEVLENVAVFIGVSKERMADNSIRVTTQSTVRTEDHVVVSSRDEITVRGTRYQVDGDGSGARINHLTGDSFGSTIELRRVVG